MAVWSSKPVRALFCGLMSALSLPLGAMLGLCFKSVPDRVTGSMMAFGAGAIVFAVATSLYGDALSHFADSRVAGCDPMYLDSPKCIASRRSEFQVILVQISTGVVGAVMYYALNEWLQKMAKATEAEVPPIAFESRMKSFARQGTMTSVMTTTGEQPRAAPLLQAAAYGDLENPGGAPERSTKEVSTGAETNKSSNTGTVVAESDGPEAPDKSSDGARVALSMWLGVALDGIPEALMLGLMVNQGEATWYFLASIFIANFPEAFSAAILLREHGVKKWKIVGMWAAIFLMTGALACISSAVMPQRQQPNKRIESLEFIDAAMEGLTSGAMFAMIATAMIPEAFHGAREGAGLPFVLGFLASCLLQAVGIELQGPQPP